MLESFAGGFGGCRTVLKAKEALVKIGSTPWPTTQLGCLLVVVYGFSSSDFYSAQNLEVKALTFRKGSEVSREKFVFVCHCSKMLQVEQYSANRAHPARPQCTSNKVRVVSIRWYFRCLGVKLGGAG